MATAYNSSFSLLCCHNLQSPFCIWVWKKPLHCQGVAALQKVQQVQANGCTRSMTDFLSLQAMGDNMVAVIPAFAQYLSDAAANNLPPASPATSDSVYFDILGLWMISYRASTAKWLHSSVLPLMLLAPPPGVQRGPMAKMAGICVLSMLCCLATPAAVGGLRAVISGVSVRLDLCTEISY